MSTDTPATTDTTGRPHDYKVLVELDGDAVRAVATVDLDDVEAVRAELERLEAAIEDRVDWDPTIGGSP